MGFCRDFTVFVHNFVLVVGCVLFMYGFVQYIIVNENVLVNC